MSIYGTNLIIAMHLSGVSFLGRYLHCANLSGFGCYLTFVATFSTTKKIPAPLYITFLMFGLNLLLDHL
jgi:hypothetical protein